MQNPAHPRAGPRAQSHDAAVRTARELTSLHTAGVLRIAVRDPRNHALPNVSNRLSSLGSGAWRCVILLTVLVACGSDYKPVSPWAMERERRIHVVEETVNGARQREAFPRCGESETPEGASRVEGLIERGSSRSCSDAGCSEANPCCNDCEKAPVLTPDDRTKKPIALPLHGPLQKLFGASALNECWDDAWWQGFGRFRARLTYDPVAFAGPSRAGAVLELCRLPDPE